MGTICIIPARSGSRRIPNKNMRPFFGKPIIDYAIEAAISSNIFDSIFVSTDSHQIGSYCQDKFREVNFLLRDPAYAGDEVGTQEVMSRHLKNFDHHGTACCIYPCVPLLYYGDLIVSYEWLDEQTDYVFSVGENPLHDAGQWYWGKSTAFREKKELLGRRTKVYPIPSQRDCDINTPEDWHRAERMYARLHGVK